MSFAFLSRISFHHVESCSLLTACNSTSESGSRRARTVRAMTLLRLTENFKKPPKALGGCASDSREETTQRSRGRSYRSIVSIGAGGSGGADWEIQEGGSGGGLRREGGGGSGGRVRSPQIGLLLRAPEPWCWAPLATQPPLAPSECLVGVDEISLSSSIPNAGKLSP